MPTKHTMWRKLIIAGDAGSGKTALCWQFKGGLFPQPLHYRPDIYFVIIPLRDGVDLHMSIREVETTEQPHRHPETSAFLIVYAVDNLQTFRNATQLWATEIAQRYLEVRSDIPVFLVANKIDMRSSSVDTVSREQGEEAARSIGAQYVETSAMTGEGVRSAFSKAATQSLAIDKQSWWKKF